MVKFPNLCYSRQANVNCVSFRASDSNSITSNMVKAAFVPANPLYEAKKNLTTKGLLFSGAIALSSIATISSFVKKQKALGWLGLGATLSITLATMIGEKRNPKEYYKPEYLEKIDYKV